MKTTLVQKIAWFLFALGFILYLGGQIVRLSIVYDLYIPGTLDLKSWYEWQVQYQTIKLYSNTFLYCSFGLIIAFLGSVIATFSSYKSFKTKGWIFMVFVLWYLSIVFAGKSLYSDFLLSYYLLSPSATTPQAIEMVTKSLKTESVYFLISILCQISIVFISIFKPLNNDKKILDETSSTL